MTKRLGPRTGQTIIESLFALPFLILIFVCAYNAFVLVIDKMRSLDTGYQMARAHQVQKMSNWRTIEILCFGRLGLGEPRVNPLGIPGPPVNEIVVQFKPYTFFGSVLPWQSVMRVVEPDAYFLNHSWRRHNTILDPPATATTLAIEALAVKTRLQTNLDTTLDASDDLLETVDAERG
jgi:hypothetical protein